MSADLTSQAARILNILIVIIIRGDSVFDSASRTESLQCLWGEAVAIDLSKSPGILSLDLCGSKMNTLKVCNHTRLEFMCIDYCDNLKPTARLWLEEKLRGYDTDF